MYIYWYILYIDRLSTIWIFLHNVVTPSCDSVDACLSGVNSFLILKTNNAGDCQEEDRGS